MSADESQKAPAIHPHRSPPLLHLPIHLPPVTVSTITPWLHINVNLHSLLPLFQTLTRPPSVVSEESDEDSDEGPRKRRKILEMPNTRFASVSYVRVYANCRVKRIWLASLSYLCSGHHGSATADVQSEDGERTMDGMAGGAEDEWGLYAAEPVR